MQFKRHGIYNRNVKDMEYVNRRFLLSSCLFIVLINHLCFSQTDQEQKKSYTDSTTSYVEMSGYGSSASRTPFWIQSNQFGTVPATGSAGRANVWLENYCKMGSAKNKDQNVWRFGMGVEVVGILSEKTQILLPQLHAALRFRNWEIYAGRKRQWVGLADSTLSSGSYAWSTNALPIPKIHFGTTRFITVPFTKEWIAFQAFYSDGWFDKNRPVTSELKLHQKAFYGRIGKPGSLVKIYGGFNHQVQWGGKSSFNTADGQMPHDLANYFNVVTGKAHSKNSGNHDNTGRVGNHLGSVDLAMEIETYRMNISIYRQNIYEDGSLFWLSNIKDGLNGIRFRKKNSYGANFEVNTIVLEFLYTKSQGGSVADENNPSWMRGKDDYFNNGQVRDGWSYFGRGIGTPFISPTSETSWKWPNYSNYFTSNNRVSVFHIGLNGTLLQDVIWTGKFSYSSNSGVYDNPFIGTPTQFSGLISLQKKLKLMGGIYAKLSLAADIGGLYPHNYGFEFGLQKNISFR